MSELGTPPVYPEPTLPTVFADGVANFNHSPEVAKFYLFRLDPATEGKGPSRPNVFAQVSMPLSGFVYTVAFFYAAVQELIKQGKITQEHWEEVSRNAQSTFKFND